MINPLITSPIQSLLRSHYFWSGVLYAAPRGVGWYTKQVGDTTATGRALTTIDRKIESWMGRKGRNYIVHMIIDNAWGSFLLTHFVLGDLSQLKGKQIGDATVIFLAFCPLVYIARVALGHIPVIGTYLKPGADL